MKTKSKYDALGRKYGWAFTREIKLGDGTGRELSALISTDVPVSRGFGNEVLSHDADAIDRSRIEALDDRLPLLMSHDATQLPIGYAHEIYVADGEMRSTLVFAEGDRADEVLRLHRAGVPVGISIGYRVEWDAAKYDEPTDTYTFERWEPREVSIVSVPADAAAMLGRNAQDQTMPTQPPSTPPNQNDSGSVVEFTAAFGRGRDDGLEAGAAIERTRLAEIDAIFTLEAVPQSPVIQAMRASAISEGWTADVVRRS